MASSAPVGSSEACSGSMMMRTASSSSARAMMWLRWIRSCSRRLAKTVTKMGLQEKITATTDALVCVTAIW